MATGTLTSTKPSATYKSLLKVQGTQQVLDSTLRVIEDGDGNDSPLKLAITGTAIGASFVGNVGIGVQDPDAALEILKAGTQFKLSYDATNYATFDIAADGLLTITTVDPDGAEADIILAPDGNVGIGTTWDSTSTTPQGALDILPSSNSADKYLRLTRSGGSNAWTIGNVSGQLRLGYDTDNNGTTDYTYLSISTAGDVTVGSGNLIVGTAGKGIDFAVQTASSVSGASTTSEVLDHYEEGTWTPIISDGTNNATMSPSGATGVYTKIGRMVHVSARVGISSLGSVSGNVILDGIPFLSGSGNGNNTAFYVGLASGLTITAGHAVVGLCDNGGDHIKLLNWDSTAGTSYLQEDEFTADGAIFIAGTYSV